MGFSTNMAFPPHHHPFMFKSLEEHHDHPTSCPPRLFHGGAALSLMKRSVSFSGMEDGHGGYDELSDDGLQINGEKKKRLNLEQVKALEKSFELGNKLEGERKIELAKALGLQPRQISIWFQNRRARWKTKQLEKDYEALKKQFQLLKSDNDALQAQNKNLSAELLLRLKTKESSELLVNMKRENGSEKSCDVMISRSSVILSTPVCNSQLSSSKQVFPSSMVRTTNMSQLLQGTCLKLQEVVQEENLCNMFNGIDQEDQQGFWAWPEHQNFH